MNQRPLYEGMRKNDARSSCRTLRVRIRRRNCVRVGPVRCYFTGSNCRHKHSKHSQAGCAPGSGLNRYGTHSPRTSRHLFSILFYPRTPARMSNRHVRPPARPLLSLSLTDRSGNIETEGCTWNEFEMNSRPLLDCPIRED